MKPCERIVYSDMWFYSHIKEIIPTTEDFYLFVHSDFHDVEKLLEISASIVRSGMNQSFIDVAKPLYPGALQHCEFFISPRVKTHYCKQHDGEAADKLIIVVLGYFLSEWFEYNSLLNATILGYWKLAPGALVHSAKRRRLFEEKKYDKEIEEYTKRNHLPLTLYKQFISKLQLHGVSNYLNDLNPHTHLDYSHVMDIFIKYLHADAERALYLALIYFSPDVIETICKR